METLQTSTSIRLEIQKIKNLPPLPVIAQQLLGIINKEETSIDQLVDIIQKDPTLTSRILGLSNSAFFGFGRKIYTLKEAIINVLGIDMVKSLAMSMIMTGVFNVNKCKGFNISRHWSSALLTADLAMRMAPYIKAEKDLDEQKLFLQGLLHNLGILILVHKFPKVMTEIFNIAKRHPERRLVYTEQAILDMDHHEAGVWLAEKWQLPQFISTVIRHHHYQDYRGDEWCSSLVIGFGSRVARKWILEETSELPVDTDEQLELLGIEKNQMNNIAKSSYSKLEAIMSVAEKMAA